MIKSSSEFWSLKNLDDYLLYAEIYYDKLHESCHTQGLYNCIAFNVVLSNAFKKKDDKGIEYPSANLFEKAKTKKETNKNCRINVRNEPLTRNNLQKKFMNRLANCY